jgi:uncharacterized protein (TIGR03437 family)
MRYARVFLLVAAAHIALGQTRSADTGQTSDRPPVVSESASETSTSRRSSSLGEPSTRRLTWYPKGGIRTAVGIAPKPYSGGVRNAARQFFAENLELFGAQFADTDVVSEYRRPDSTVVRLQQILNGLPVLGSEVAIVVGPDNVVTEVYSRYAGVLRSADQWLVTEDRARTVALSAAKCLDCRVQVASKAFRPNGSDAVPVWLVVVSTLRPAKDSEVLISAIDGSIVEINELQKGTPRGWVYPNNPVTSALTQVDLTSLTSPTNLTGTYAQVISYLFNLAGLLPPDVFGRQLAQADASGDYPYQPGDPRFSEVQLYYGVTTAAQKFKALGVPDAQQPLPSVVDYADYSPLRGYVGQNNAFFAPFHYNGGPGLFFYLTQRGFDVAWDCDVIWHEYTHYIVYRAVGYRQSQTFSALNEGFADYFAASFSNDPNVAEWAALIFGDRTPALRTVANDKRFPNSLVGEVHLDGTIWSGALWEMRQTIGADKADRIIINTIPLLNGGSEYYDAAQAVINTSQLMYGSTVGSQVSAIMQRRGLTTLTAELASRATSLSSSEITPGSLSPSQPGIILISDQQYRISVPAQATALRLQIQATGNVKGYFKFRAPIVVENGTSNAEQVTEIASNIDVVVDARNIPELQTGDYYIAIGNASTSPVNFVLKATAIIGSDQSSVRTSVLVPGTPSAGSAPSGPFLASRQFAIDVPTGTNSLTVRLAGTTDVDLYVNQGTPVMLNDQGLPEADIVAATYSSTESTTITSSTIPGITPGRYYIAAYNYDATAATQFSVTATIGSGGGAPPAVIGMPANGGASINCDAATSTGVLGSPQISIEVPPTATALTLTATTGLETLIYIQKGTAITLQGGMPRADRTFVVKQGTASIRLDANSLPQLSAGTYYIAAGNFSALSGTVHVDYKLEGGTTANQPKLSGIISLGDFGALSTVTAGSLVEIYGSNLSTTTRKWSGADFNGVHAPTSLDGVSVTVAGKPAFVNFVSPGQVNIQVPEGIGTGSVPIVVANAGGTSNGFPTTAANTAAGMLAPASFKLNGMQYVAAFVGPDYRSTFALPTGAIAGVPSRPAKPGETIVIYGVGFGPVSPSMPAGSLPSGANTLVNALQVFLGGTPATVSYDGLSGDIGVYQINAIVPPLADSDAVPLTFSLGSTKSTQQMYIAVHR